MKSILAAALVMTLSMSSLATELDLKNLPPKTKDRIADYVKQCELAKKNVETVSQAHTECVERPPETNLFLLGGVGLVLGIVGYVLGAGGK